MKCLETDTIHIEDARVCSLSGKCVLNGISTRLRRGQLVGVIGPSGAGKSVLFQVLTGHAKLDSGSVQLNGFPLRNWPAKKLSIHVAAAPEPGIDMRADARISTLVPDARVRRIAALEHLHERTWTELSCRERRRVQLGMALHRALSEESVRYLWLDEPDADLDLAHRIALMQALRGLASGGLSVLCVLHHVELARTFPDEVIVLQDGCVLRQGPPRQVLPEALRAASGFVVPQVGSPYAA